MYLHNPHQKSNTRKNHTLFNERTTRLTWISFLVIFTLAMYSQSQSVSAKSAVSTVQFEVDMRAMTNLRHISELDVSIRGNLAPLGWSKSKVRLEDRDQDGIYSTQVDFYVEDKQELEFRFVVAGGRIWEQRDNRKLLLVANQTETYRAKFEHSERVNNPFSHYLGQWQFDSEGFSIVWDGAPVVTTRDMTQITQCHEVNHDRSILCVISDSQDPFLRGHIMWTYDSTNQKVHWLSHFFPDRNGVGIGEIDKDGNLTAKVRFENEPKGTYRIYHWRWLNDNSYNMISRQFNANDEPTGDWYGGTSIRSK